MINLDKFVYTDEDVLEFIVLKHGTGDQKAHGNWAIGRVSVKLTQSILDRVKANGGLSVNMKDGSEPTKGYMVASPVKQAPVVDADDFFNVTKGRKILADFVKANKKDLGGGKKYLGLWHNKEDNKVYLDVSENVQDKSTATRLGRQRNQISIWDVVNFDEIETGGTGVTEKRRDSDGGVTIRYIGDDRRTNRFLGGFDLRQNDEVGKHSTHDQSSHAGSRRRIGPDASETDTKKPKGEQEVTDPNAPKPKLKPGRKPDASGTLEERAEKLANGERIQVTKGEAKKMMKIMAKREDNPDLTNMHIEGTQLYDEDNLGIPRKQMPQVPSDTKGAFINEMEKRGARVQRGVADPSKLHPIQAEMSASKVGLIMKSLRKKGVKTDDGGRIVISKDNYVIDGHHRWAAAAMLTFEGNPIKLPVIKVDINHRELIAATLAWNEASGISGIGMGESNTRGQLQKWAEFDSIIAKAVRGRTIIRFQPGLKPVVKHQQHDQSSHGNWAGKNNFKGNTYYDKLSESFQEQGFDDAIDKYSTTFGIDKGKYFGTNAYEANSVLSYTGNGFDEINYYARRLNQSTPTITDGNSLEDTANRMINHIDKVIANSPDIFGETTLYRVFSDKVIENLEEGDILRNKGFLSTTRVNITESSNNNLRALLSGIKPSLDTVGVIRPSRGKKGKGLAVDLYKAILNEPMGQSLMEKEVLLPRNTSLKFLGFETDDNNFIGSRIAIFERMD